MDEEKIKEILEDPNTWAWDGCTYPEWNEAQEKQFKEEKAKFLARYSKK